jgi:hypothetical protein
VGGIALHAALFAALKQKPGHFLNEQRNAAGTFSYAVYHFLR